MITNERLAKDYAKVNEQKSYEGFTIGQIIALNSYNYTNDNYDTNEITIYDNVWQKDYDDLLNYLREAEIKAITITNSSSGLMEFLHFLVSNNCLIDNAVEVRKLNKIFGQNSIDKGLRVIIK